MAVSKKWRETETIKFVRLYEEAECLWNYRHPAYKNRSAREKACQTIIESMNMPEFGVNELKNKIKNIRSTYAQELNKIKRSREGLSAGGSDQEEYKTNLAWFAIANRFLGTVIATTSNSNKMSKSEDSSAADFSNSDFQLTTLVKTDIDGNPEYADESREVYYPPITFDHTQIKAESSNDDYPLTCKRMRILHNSEINDDKETDLEASDVRDEFFYFGKNIACQLRQLPLDKALLCQSKILGLLMTYRVEALHSV
ncbi:uncharacterized protein LOC132698014 isoform X2 [Cylas formicarius]|nr:uncharacterized protein LOC132698014 isoform X2 [Cylas formicarius]XP_060519824.1 uncharacterized protein LOC132698014 isoform X2 [Cylas formicarius]XP_060519825.1 uncharacterized protein LOC132698014 isoform X2 [Cylas formicarius]